MCRERGEECENSGRIATIFPFSKPKSFDFANLSFYYNLRRQGAIEFFANAATPLMANDLQLGPRLCHCTFWSGAMLSGAGSQSSFALRVAGGL
jgi:hypothetical protein